MTDPVIASSSRSLASAPSPAGSRRRLVPAERSEIVRERARGVGAQALAVRFGVSRQTIHAVVRGMRAAQATTGVRSRVVSTRVSEGDLAAFDAVLAGTGLSRSESLGRMVQGAAGFFVPEVGEAEALRRATAALDRAGGNVNQIARALNEARLKGQTLPFTAGSNDRLKELAQAVFELADHVQALARGRQAELRAATVAALARPLTGQEPAKQGTGKASKRSKASTADTLSRAD